MGLLASSIRRLAHNGTTPHKRVHPGRSGLSRRLGLEPLESRTLLSLAPTLTTLDISNPAPLCGQPITLAANVAAAPPSSGVVTGGTVSFFDGDTPLGTAPLLNGRAALVNSLMTAGAFARSRLQRRRREFRRQRPRGGDHQRHRVLRGAGGNTAFALPGPIPSGNGERRPVPPVPPASRRRRSARPTASTTSPSARPQPTAPARPSPSSMPTTIPTSPATCSSSTRSSTCPTRCSPRSIRAGAPAIRLSTRAGITEIALDVEWAHADRPGGQHPAGRGQRQFH